MKNILRLIDQKKIAIFSLLILDLVFFLISFLFAYYLRNAFAPYIQEVGVYLNAVPVAFVLLVVVFYLFGLYEQRIRVDGMSEFYTVTKAVLMTAIVFMAVSFLYKYDYSRGFVLIFIASGLVFLNLGRIVYRVFAKMLIKKGIGIKRVLIIGAGKQGRKIARQIELYKDFGYKLIGFLDDNIKDILHEMPVYGTTDELSKIIKEKKIDMVFISDPNMPHTKMLELITEADEHKVKFKLVSNIYQVITGHIDISEIEGIPAIDINPYRSTWLYRFVKRILDVVLSLFGLVILFPLWMLIVIFIRFDSKGSALIKQKRVGMNGRDFNMYKFRTMHSRADLYEKAPTGPDDERVTKFGKFLRKTSLDEFPQLINIIKGEMSLVGPRPEMPFIVKDYTKWQRKRLQVKPGLTGLWQILGRKDLPLHENIEYDFYYIQNQSFILDLAILAKTIWTVITGKGAY